MHISSKKHLFACYLSFLLGIIASQPLWGQTTVFFDDFESGGLASTVWTANPGPSNGLAGVINTIYSCSGTYHLRLGKTSDAGGLNTAYADLSIALGTNVDSQLALSFCIVDFGDEFQVADGVFVRASTGSSFVKIIDFSGQTWNNSSWGKRVPYDLDQLIKDALGTIPANIVLRFQQQGTGDFNFSGDEDGIAIDNIRIQTEPPHTYGTLPYFEDFATGVIPNEWEISSRKANDSLGGSWLTRFPRLGIAGATNSLYLGKNSDLDGAHLNAIDLNLALGTYVDSQLLLSFTSYDYYDNPHTTLEGVFASIDHGADFKQIITFDVVSWANLTFGNRVPYDLDQLIKSVFNISTLPDTLILRFQQYGTGDFNTSSDEDGIILDNISIDVDPAPTYASLPYVEDFSSGVFSSEWRVSSREANDSLGGNWLTRFPLVDISGVNNHLYLGKTSDAESNNLNAIDLNLSLGTYVDSQLRLSFTTYDFYDNPHPTLEGVFASINKGEDFKQIISFDVVTWTNVTFGRRVPYDLDQLLKSTFNISVLPDTLILRFQQYGNGDFNTSSEEDGILLDDIRIEVDPSPPYVSIPYVADFEGGKFGPEWKINSEKAINQTTLSNSINQLNRFWRTDVANSTAAFSGTYLVWLSKTRDAEGANLNALDLHLDLKGESQVQLKYRIYKYYDEQQVDDGVFLSVDGGKTFVLIYNLNLANLTNRSWRTETIDLSLAAANNNLTLSDSTVIRFQQYGTGDLNTSSDEDGYGLDLIEVNCLPQVAEFEIDVDCSNYQVVFTDSSRGTNANTPYAWDFTSDGIIDTVGNGNMTYTFPGTGTYDVTLFIGNKFGCGDSITKQVFIGSSVPAPSITPAGSPLALCQNDTLNLCAPVGYQGYLWSTGETTICIDVTSPGTYSVRGLGIDGCYSAPTSVTVNSRTSPLKPFLSLMGSNDFCEGDSVEIVAPFGASAYLWNTGETTQSLVVKQAGTYSVKIANSFGCFSPPADTTIRVISVPQPVISQTTGTDTLTSSISGQSYSWFLNGNPIGNNSISIDAAAFGSGTYTVQISRDGCLSEVSDPYVFTATSIELGSLEVLQIYPNPTEGWVNIDLQRSKLDPIHIQVYNSLGQEILPALEVPDQHNWQGKIDLSSFPPGVYMIKLSSPKYSTIQRILTF